MDMLTILEENKKELQKDVYRIEVKIGWTLMVYLQYARQW